MLNVNVISKKYISICAVFFSQPLSNYLWSLQLLYNITLHYIIYDLVAGNPWPVDTCVETYMIMSNILYNIVKQCFDYQKCTSNIHTIVRELVLRCQFSCGTKSIGFSSHYVFLLGMAISFIYLFYYLLFHVTSCSPTFNYFAC